MAATLSKSDMEESVADEDTDTDAHIEYPVFRCGIHNLGNTCFLNSSVQVLARLRRFAQWIRNKGYLSIEGWEDRPKHLQFLMNMVQDIFDAIRTPETSVLTPNGFYNSFRQTAVAENMDWLMQGQNDSHECTMFLLDALHKSISKDITETDDIKKILGNKQNLLIKGSSSTLRRDLDLASDSSWYTHFGKEFSSIMTDMFHGQYLSIITSKVTDERSFGFEPFSSISLAVPEDGPSTGGSDGSGFISVKDCLDKFFNSEDMKDDSKWESPSAGKVDAVRGTRIWRLPEVLILSLKRFTMTGGKVRTTISYPLTGLDMKDYCTGMALDEDDTVYDLVGVIIHVGIMFGGHYYSVVRNPGDKWILVNDTRVGYVDKERVLNNPDAYTLVYQKSSILKKDDLADSEWLTKYIKDKKPSKTELEDISKEDAEDEGCDEEDDHEDWEGLKDDAFEV
jgi:ubiquitin C-terminal hydrolase